VKSQEKVEVVEGLRERFARANIAILAEPRGLTVAQVTRLRRKVRDMAGEYKVAKNTLTKRAVDDTGFAPLSPMLKGPTALVLGYGDPVALAKEMLDYAGQNSQQIAIKGAFLDGQLFGRDQVEALGKLETKDQVRAKLLGLLCAPASRLVRTLNEPGAALARVIAARGESAAAPGESTAAPDDA
jgi:large subunit ribosomal protein L10